MAVDPGPPKGVDPQGSVMFSPAWPTQPSRTLSRWPLGAPLALSGRAHLEGQPGINYWVLRAAGTKKVRSRPRPTGSCFEFVSALVGKAEDRSHQHEDRLLHRKKECVQLKLDPSPADG